MHCIFEDDLGYVAGSSTWHNMAEYKVIGNRPIAYEEVMSTVNTYDIEKVPTFVYDSYNESYKPSGSYAVQRRNHEDNKIKVLAPSVGDRYVAEHHKTIANMFYENLLAVFPDLKVCGVGTLSSARTWWIQLVAEQYFIRGDESPNELRLSYSHTYGVDAHQIYCTTVRLVCDNTRRMGIADAIAHNMMRKHRHTKSATMKINTDMELMAELHMAVEKDKELMNYLADKPVNEGYVQAFMQEFFPKPAEDDSTRSKNQWESDSRKVAEIFQSGQNMSGDVKTSRYALLNAFTDFTDHHSYTRNVADRWFDAQNGKRSLVKDTAIAWLAK